MPLINALSYFTDFNKSTTLMQDANNITTFGGGGRKECVETFSYHVLQQPKTSLEYECKQIR